MSLKTSFYNQIQNNQEFDQLKISIASPEQIKSWSFGEVQKAETINYRTFKPEKEGLFCAKIFGPIRDYECLCGKYKQKMKYRNVICEKCGVEVTTSSVRRDRMGHIDLASPVVHVWFLKSLPSKISTILDISIKDLDKIISFENYIVSKVEDNISLKIGEVLTEDRYNEALDQYGDFAFKALIGPEGIKELLQDLNLAKLHSELKDSLKTINSDTKRKKIIKRLKLVDDFMNSGSKPEWMVLDVLSVMPPDLRPLVMLDGGRFATADLNELYRRVVNRNNRLKKLIHLNAPDIIIRNEKRMLQESVDALLDNGRRGKIVKNSSKRPLKSLSDMLKGKQGRFRQNLLGKRVDYSGRSVIVVGPELKLHQCGIPKKMALELCKPFIYSKLQMLGIVNNIKIAKKMVEEERVEVFDVLEDVIREHPVLLNRAPTLHRLGIQAFEPHLIEGKAIQLHPLVCAAFNADFDGDQMAVHIPLSIEAQLESRVLMMSTNNILSPANGKPIISADKDIVLGVYYLTMDSPVATEKVKVFLDFNEVQKALFAEVVNINSTIKVRHEILDIDGKLHKELVETTVGRTLIGSILPKSEKIDFSIVNRVMNKKIISEVINLVHRYCGEKECVVFSDKLMALGFKYACKSGVSFGMDDMVVPESKFTYVDKTAEKVNEFENQYAEGLITFKEKYNKVTDIWSHCTDKIASDMMTKISKPKIDSSTGNIYINSIYLMAISGARGSAAQIKQLAGMRGLMAKPSGEIIETPIISNFSEGLTEREYFNSTHGARKGLVDIALKTANSGYLTRRLVDVAQDCVVINEECGTDEGISIKPIIEEGEVTVSLADQVLGRIAIEKVYHPLTNELLVDKNDMINEQKIDLIESAGIKNIKIRSVLTCRNYIGVCANCYGRDLATGIKVSIGEAVGVIAAQSIGEPGTQLTMRTFHIGGAATKRVEVSSVEAEYDAKVKILGKNLVVNSQGYQMVMSRSCEVVLLDIKSNKELRRYKVPYGARLMVDDVYTIQKGQKIAEWNPYNIPILTEKSGKVVFTDMVNGISLNNVDDKSTGITSKVIIESKKYLKGRILRPSIRLLDDQGEFIKSSNGVELSYYLPVNTVLNVEEGDHIAAGDIIARIPTESDKTKDITGGLPRVVDLVEARKPKDYSIISEIEGYIRYTNKDTKSKKKVIISSRDGSESIEYVIPKGKHLMFAEGDLVKKGDMIVDGNPVLQDILKVLGVEALTRYMIQEIQSVYRLQSVKIDDKHIEVILRQMLQKFKITDPGDTTLLQDELISKKVLNEINEKIVAEGGRVAKAELVLQGITKASLQTDSFISSASFQETTKVLTEAAVAGKVDNLVGLKENVIVGRLIPAGTGFFAKNKNC